MRTRTAAIWLLAVTLGTAFAKSTAYRTEVTVTPAAAPHEYTVTFRIATVPEAGKADTLCSPTLVVKAGQEGKIRVGDDEERNGVFCTALVKETDDGLRVVTSVVVKEAGEEKSNSTQCVTVKR